MIQVKRKTFSIAGTVKYRFRIVLENKGDFDKSSRQKTIYNTLDKIFDHQKGNIPGSNIDFKVNSGSDSYKQLAKKQGLTYPFFALYDMEQSKTIATFKGNTSQANLKKALDIVVKSDNLSDEDLAKVQKLGKGAGFSITPRTAAIGFGILSGLGILYNEFVNTKK